VYKSQNLRQNLAGKVWGDLSVGHKIREFFCSRQNTQFPSKQDNTKASQMPQDNAVYSDNGEDYADLLHPVQVLKNYLRRRSLILDHKRTRFSGDDLYVEWLILECIW